MMEQLKVTALFSVLFSINLFVIINSAYYDSSVALLGLFEKDVELTSQLIEMYKKQPLLQSFFTDHANLQDILTG